ncbi:hypothetical protein PJM41_0052 [Salmonella phage vB_SenS_UTK0009]|uniref:Uncharacterized protein n=1 Tax=Salmonella phage vB_SenS_UTK0009 TaxID=3028908 RepID=A0AAE9ZMW0_9CAUD|nr:hypothetical protein PJM41_0052 [Salmonella phage vB_SenS_UTK0009]
MTNYAIVFGKWYDGFAVVFAPSREQAIQMLRNKAAFKDREEWDQEIQEVVELTKETVHCTIIYNGE